MKQSFFLLIALNVFVLGFVEICSSNEGATFQLNKQNEKLHINTEDVTKNDTFKENLLLQASLNSSTNKVSGNETRPNITYKVSCIMNDTSFIPVVEIVNSTKLLSLMQVQPNVTTSQTPATCIVVLFYSPSCPFSCMAAPHFNALPRVFPDIQMTAVDTSIRYNFNAQYGIVGLPSVLLFHNGRPAARFNSSSEFTLEEFAKFITNNTGLNPEGKLFVTSSDFAGPISSVPVRQTDYFLILSWLFILLCILYFFYYSTWCQWLVDNVKNAWREAEAQHQHND